MTNADAPPEPVTSSGICLWCQKPFRVRRGGSPKRFCCPTHRMAFWSALRRWAERVIAADVLTIADIRDCAGAACTLLPNADIRAREARPITPAESPAELLESS
jgi:hypothetical protein